MEALSSSETAVLTRATRRNIPDDVLLRFRDKSDMHTAYYASLWLGLSVRPDGREDMPYETSASSYQST
jgi:hypothetical protein